MGSIQPSAGELSRKFPGSTIFQFFIICKKPSGSSCRNIALFDGCRGSPISILISMEEMKQGRDLDLKRCLEMEFRMTKFFLRGHGDLYEGIRAKLIDKHSLPDWRFKSIDEVRTAGSTHNLCIDCTRL